MVSLSDREHDFKVQVNGFSLTYPKEMLEEFFQYWTEPNKSGTRMKWELEKTWHLGRRLARWANNDFGKGKVEVKKEVRVEAENEFSEINDFLLRYKARPTNFKLEDFGKWYEFLKCKGMLKKFSQDEIDLIVEAFQDKEKRRCAAVMKTFDFYGTWGKSFSDIKNIMNGGCNK